MADCHPNIGIGLAPRWHTMKLSVGSKWCKRRTNFVEIDPPPITQICKYPRICNQENIWNPTHEGIALNNIKNDYPNEIFYFAGTRYYWCKATKNAHRDLRKPSNGNTPIVGFSLSDQRNIGLRDNTIIVFFCMINQYRTRDFCVPYSFSLCMNIDGSHSEF